MRRWSIHEKCGMFWHFVSKICYLSAILRTEKHADQKLPNWHREMSKRSTLIIINCDYTTFSSFLLADSYWSIAVSTTWRHCRRSAARRKAESMPVLKCWTSRDTVFNHVSRRRPLGLLHPADGLLIAATTTLWWSSSYDLLARWPKSWSLLMRTNLEAAEQPVVLLTLAFVTWRVYGMRSILLWHHMSYVLSWHQLWYNTIIYIQAM